MIPMKKLVPILHVTAKYSKLSPTVDFYFRRVCRKVYYMPLTAAKLSQISGSNIDFLLYIKN